MRRAAPFLNGDHLRAARTVAGLSRKGLAALSQLHPCTVKDWELAGKPPVGVAVSRMRAVLEARGVRVAVVPGERGGIAQIMFEPKPAA